MKPSTYINPFKMSGDNILFDINVSTFEENSDIDQQDPKTIII
jgi:hypothetical protein